MTESLLKLQKNVNDYIVSFLMEQLKGTECDRVIKEWKKNENQKKIKNVLVNETKKKERKKLVP